MNSTEDRIGRETLEIIASAEQFNKWMFDKIRPFLKGEVLEIGCGIGNISNYVLEEGFNLTLSDYNIVYTEIVRNRFEKKPTLKNIYAIDLLDPYFEKKYSHLQNQFDSIFLLNVIEHLDNDSLAASNCKFLLKSGGNLILLAPAYQWLYCTLDKNLGHYRRHTKSSLSILLKKNNLTLIDSTYFNAGGILGWLLYGKILDQQQLKRGNMKLFSKLLPFFKIIDFFLNRLIGLSVIVVGQHK
jgi:2-polyprenyl-3-methyl-5-hydroxy-6-metoxy-1,4-benzoquinol methylase